MDFNARQMHEDALIKKGRYKFRVLQGREKRSSNGNDMLNLKIALSIGARDVTFFDSLILTPKMFWKIEHFCKATGMPEKIDDGRLMAQDCDGRAGYLDIEHRQNQETGEIEAYVKDYVKPENLNPEELEEAGFVDDDIPVLS